MSAVTDFSKIREEIEEKKTEFIKQRKFDVMRKKLNRELEVRAIVQKSMYPHHIAST
jgi:hypothetical protein